MVEKGHGGGRQKAGKGSSHSGDDCEDLKDTRTWKGRSHLEKNCSGGVKVVPPGTHPRRRDLEAAMINGECTSSRNISTKKVPKRLSPRGESLSGSPVGTGGAGGLRRPESTAGRKKKLSA